MSKPKKAEAIKIMKTRHIPDPGQAFWDGYWNRLESRMNAEGAFETMIPAPAVSPAPRRAVPLVPRWALASAAGVALLLVGIQIGRWTGPAGRVSGPSPQPNAALAGEVADYLTRSKVILLSLANFDPGTEDPRALSPAVQQQVSRELVDRGRKLDALLAGPGGKRYRNLIAELKTILVQIANLDPEENAQAVEIVRDGVKVRDILFKISISLMSLPDSGKSSRTGL